MNGKDVLEMEIEFINNFKDEFIIRGDELEIINKDSEFYEYLEQRDEENQY